MGVIDTPTLDGCFQQVLSEGCPIRDVVRHPRNQNDVRIYSGDQAVSGKRLLTFPDGRYSPAVGVDGILVMTGVRTLYGLTPR